MYQKVSDSLQTIATIIKTAGKPSIESLKNLSRGDQLAISEYLKSLTPSELKNPKTIKNASDVTAGLISKLVAPTSLLLALIAGGHVSAQEVTKALDTNKVETIVSTLPEEADIQELTQIAAPLQQQIQQSEDDIIKNVDTRPGVPQKVQKMPKNYPGVPIRRV